VWQLRKLWGTAGRRIQQEPEPTRRVAVRRPADYDSPFLIDDDLEADPGADEDLRQTPGEELHPERAEVRGSIGATYDPETKKWTVGVIGREPLVVFLGGSGIGTAVIWHSESLAETAVNQDNPEQLHLAEVGVGAGLLIVLASMVASWRISRRKPGAGVPARRPAGEGLGGVGVPTPPGGRRVTQGRGRRRSGRGR
jgi:hypothetical protein